MYGIKRMETFFKNILCFFFALKKVSLNILLNFLLVVPLKAGAQAVWRYFYFLKKFRDFSKIKFQFKNLIKKFCL